MEIGYSILKARIFNSIELKRFSVKVTIENKWIELNVGKYKVLLDKKPRPLRSVDIMYLLSRIPGKIQRVVGIDLSASPKRPSGWALLEGSRVKIVKTLTTDEEIIEETRKAFPAVVSIDAPLSRPKPGKIIRECERILRSRGIFIYPAFLPSMKRLTIRGERLKKKMRRLGIEVIESYPGAAQDILQIVRKRVNLNELKRGLINFGLSGDINKKDISHDELDAITSALVGYFYLANLYERVGLPDEGEIIIPQKLYEPY
jgi:predicted nuclease with RNAse H fold